jgi:hypothetical protein
MIVPISKPMRRKLIWTSLIATACGWIAGNLFFIAYAGLVWGSFTDVEVVVFWTTPFALLSWLFFFIPLIFMTDYRSVLLRLPVFTFVGALVGITSFLVLVGWWAPLWQESYAYLIHPAVTGAAAATAYSCMVRSRINDLKAR